MTFSDLMKKLLLLGWFVASFAGCPKPSPTPIPPPIPEPQVWDAGDEPIAPPIEYTCADLCKHMFDLHCMGAEPTPNGATCLDVCQNLQTSGVVVLDLKCRTKARTCAAIDACK